MYSNLSTGLDTFLGLQEFEIPRISRQSAYEGVKGSALPTGRHYTSYSLLLEVVPTSGP